MNNLYKYIFLTVLSCSAWYNMLAQDPVHRVLNNLNGLPSNSIYNIIQDKKGFIWLAHDKGLSRYDSKQLIYFKNKSAQSKSLSNLLEVNNSIWCQDFAGNFYTTTPNQQLTKSVFSTPGVYTPAGYVNKQFISIKYDSIKTYNIKTNTQKSFAVNNVIHQAVCYTDSAVYFINNNYLTSFNGTTFTTIAVVPNTKASFNFLVKGNKNFFAITRNTFPYIYIINNPIQTYLSYLPKGIFVQDACVIDNEIWLCTSTGAYCFDKDFSPKYNGKCFFEKSSISKVYKDKEGNYWFSTLNNGVFIVSNINAVLYPYNMEGFSALALKENGFLIGTTANNILTFDLKKSDFKKLYQLPNNHEVLHILNNEKQHTTFISSDKLSVLYNNKSLNEITIASKKTVFIQKNLYAIAYASGIALVTSNEKFTTQDIPTWLQTRGSFIEKNIYKLKLNTGRCRDVLFDSTTQTLYAATANGILYFSPNNKGEIKHNNNSIYASSLCLYNNMVFAATFSQNVIAITNKKETTQLQVTDNAIYKIYPYNNSLFLIADDGLIQYNISNKIKTIYTNADGLPKAEIKDVQVINNQIYVATSLGLICFKTTDKKVNTIAPSIEVNEVLVNGDKVIFQNNTSFAHNQNNITIYFSTLSYKSDDRIKTLYKINNQQWQLIDNNSSSINLPSLAPNTYTLLIKAVNEDGIESVEPIKLSFAIQAPFYKQLWFFIAISSIIIAVILLYFKMKITNQQQKNNLLAEKLQLEQDLQQSMLASIKSQMNPHFLFNALNTVQSYIYTNERENAGEYLGKFSELTRIILEMSNTEFVSIATEIRALQLYLDLEKQRFEDKLNYHFYFDESINTENNHIPSMLIQPYVENAIKHGLLHSKHNWQLNIHFEKSNNGIRVKIDDNGIGRKRSLQLNKQRNIHHQSFSTEANKKRLVILNKGLPTAISVEIIDKEDDRQFALGTTVLLHIPFL